MCVCERERERERENLLVHLYMCMCTCVNQGWTINNVMKYRHKYFHDNITVSILAYRDNHANDNTVDATCTKSLSAMQCSGCNLKMYSTTRSQCITIVRIMILY